MTNDSLETSEDMAQPVPAGAQLASPTPATAGVEAPTAEFKLRAMARNYRNGHSWDRLDCETCTAAADEIAKLRTAMESLSGGAKPVAPGSIRDEIREVLGNHRLAHTIEDGDNGGVPLVDMLTPKGDGSIARGAEELDLLADEIFLALAPLSAGEAPQAPVQAVEVTEAMIQAGVDASGMGTSYRHPRDVVAAVLRAALASLPQAAPAAAGEAVAQPVGAGWQPIETAPKDGTYILVGSAEDCGSWVASYVPIYQSGYVPANPWQCMMLNCDHLPRDRKGALRPTHWKPLDAAPGAQPSPQVGGPVASEDARDAARLDFIERLYRIKADKLPGFDRTRAGQEFGRMVIGGRDRVLVWDGYPSLRDAIDAMATQGDVKAAMAAAPAGRPGEGVV